MRFQHASEIWRDHPELAAGAIFAEGIHTDVSVEDRLAGYHATAAARLAAAGAEGRLPEIQAWRRTFARMGLKPTKYRCAAESLLRRFHKEGTLPRLHPLVDLCNAISIAYAVPVAVLDVCFLTDEVVVRYADGDELYLTLAGEPEHPAAGEVVFADAARHAHARRWTHRQSGHSIVRPDTAGVLIVAEAMHESAATDVRHLVDAVATELAAGWAIQPTTAILTAAEPALTFTPAAERPSVRGSAVPDRSG